MEAEQQLRASLEKRKELETVVNNSPAVAFLWKAATGWPVEFVSENVKQFGYAAEEFTSGKVSYAQVIHPEDLGRVGEEVAAYSNEGRNEFTQEYRILTKNGDVRWLEDRTWVRKDAKGAITHYQGIVIDITDRKRERQTLELLKSAVEQVNESVIITDAQLDFPGPRIVFVNPSFTKMTGYTAEEVMGKTPRILQGPLSDRKMLKQLKAALKQGDSFSINTVNYRKDKTPMHIQVHITPLRSSSGKIIHYVGIQRDTTEEKKVEGHLLQLASIVNAAHDAIMSLTPEGVIENWNAGAEEMYGYTADEAIGKDLSLIVTEERKNEIPVLLEKNKQGEVIKDFETIRRRKDGTLVPVSLTRSPIVDKNGVIVGIVMIQRDISERIKAEQEIRKLNEAMAARLADLERFNKVAIGRELKMVELKKKIKELEARLGVSTEHSPTNEQLSS
jgi:PAS domain S-box-containing protein